MNRPRMGSHEADDEGHLVLAWFIHDHLPYSEMVFFVKNAAVAQMADAGQRLECAVVEVVPSKFPWGAVTVQLDLLVS